MNNILVLHKRKNGGKSWAMLDGERMDYREGKKLSREYKLKGSVDSKYVVSSFYHKPSPNQ